MIAIILVVIIAIIFFICYFINGNVTPTPTEEYNSTKSKPTSSMVLYYSNSCGYCEMFMPTWKQFEEYASKSIPNVSVSKVSCDEDGGKKCYENGIEGYPTVIIYPMDGSRVMFQKDRTLEELVKFAQQHTK